MKALILAAGRGERMRPLTDTTPKPLLALRGKPLIEWHLAALARAGVREVVINTAWLEQQFQSTLAKALPWLAPRGDEVFWVVSGDIHIPGFAFDGRLAEAFAAGTDLGLLWLVPNPDFHGGGDFNLDGQRLKRGAPHAWTYANVALLRPALVGHLPLGQPAPLGPLLFDAAAADRLAGRVLEGEWHNLGTPAQLAALNAR